MVVVDAAHLRGEEGMLLLSLNGISFPGICHLGSLLVKNHGNAVRKLGLLRHRHYVIDLDALGHIHAQVVGAWQGGHILQRGRVEDPNDGLGTTHENEALVDAEAVGVAGAALHPLVQQAAGAKLHQMSLTRDGVRALRADALATCHRTEVVVPQITQNGAASHQGNWILVLQNACKSLALAFRTSYEGLVLMSFRRRTFLPSCLLRDTNT